jgi:hypothetical protein
MDSIFQKSKSPLNIFQLRSETKKIIELNFIIKYKLNFKDT